MALQLPEPALYRDLEFLRVHSGLWAIISTGASTTSNVAWAGLYAVLDWTDCTAAAAPFAPGNDTIRAGGFGGQDTGATVEKHTCMEGSGTSKPHE